MTKRCLFVKDRTRALDKNRTRVKDRIILKENWEENELEFVYALLEFAQHRESTTRSGLKRK